MDIDKITISKFGEMTKLSKKALRLYDEKGLLEPSIRDPINNYRYYTLDQLENAVRIKLLSTIGFGIEEMKAILEAVEIGNKQFLDQTFRKKQTEIQLEIERLQKIEEIISSNKPTELLYLQCSDPQIRVVPKTRVISQRKIGNYSRDVPKIISNLMVTLQSSINSKNQVKIVGPIMLLVHDTEYKHNDADIEIAIPISGRIQLESDDIELKNLPETKVVSLIYTGPYADVGIGYTKAHEFALKNGYEIISGEAREIYLNSPQDVPNEQLMTELQLRIHEEQENQGDE